MTTTVAKNSIPVLRLRGAGKLPDIFRKSPKFSLVPLLIPFLLIIALSFIVPVLNPIDPTKTDLVNRLALPSFLDPGSPYILGTDALGRDVLIRLCYATRATVSISVTGLLLSTALGLTLGVTASLFGGIADLIITFMIDATMAIPPLLIGIVVSSILGPGVHTIVTVTMLTSWIMVARLVRAQVLQLKQSKFIESSKLFGASKLYIVFRHILVNIASPLIVECMLLLAGCILFESSLSFLGLGLTPPETSLGLMVSDGRDYLIEQWWLAIAPSCLIVLLIIQVSLIGDWLRNYLDPKSVSGAGQ